MHYCFKHKKEINYYQKHIIILCFCCKIFLIYYNKKRKGFFTKMKYLILILLVSAFNPFWGQYYGHHYGKPLVSQSAVSERYKFKWHFGARKNMRLRNDSGYTAKSSKYRFSSNRKITNY